MSTLKDRRIWDPAKNQGEGGYRVRTKDNMAQLKVIFLEVDVAKPGEPETDTKYKDMPSAARALRDFVKRVGLPKPMIVVSGYGLHVYWPLAKPIPVKSGDKLLKAIKALALNAGFKLDTQALDISRVFRPVGTHNHKNPDDPKLVKVLRDGGDPVDPMEFGRTIKAAREKYGVEVEIKSTWTVPSFLNFGDGNLKSVDDSPLQFDLLMRCGALNEVADKQGDVSYGQWYHALQVVRFTENGAADAHRISSGGESYDPDAVEKHLADLSEKGIAPTLCSTFAAETDACKDCPWNGQINSPAALGRPKTKELQESAPEAEEAIKLDDVEIEPGKVTQIPAPPQPYSRRQGQGIYMEVTNSRDDKIDVQIFANDLYPMNRKFNERENCEYTRWMTGNPADGPMEVEIPSRSLYDKRTFAGVMADVGAYLPPEHIDDVRNYMVAYIQELQKHIKREELYSRLGWRDSNTKFVLGDKLYNHDGSIDACQIERNNRAAQGIRTEGTFEEWRKVVDLYNRDEFVAHQFALGVAFGAPLMKFAGQAGGIVNLLGKSGEGKSTIQKLVNSVWGHPIDLMLPAEANSSTQNAKIGYIHLLNNLPVCAEEVTNVSAQEVQSLAYAVNTGEEKMRMQRSGELKPARGGWNTIMLSSSNSSLYDKLMTTQGSAATSLRILEIRMPMVRTYSKTEFFQNFEVPLQTNFGHAGHRYARALAKNADKVRDTVFKVMASLDKQSQAGNEERVWLAVGACVIAGLAIAKSVGLHDFDVKKVERFLLAQVNVLRNQTKEMHTAASETLAAFVDGSQRHMLVVEPMGIAGAGKDVSVVSKPYDGLDIRYDLHKNRMTISSRAFRNWCTENGLIHTDVINELRADGIITQTNVLRTLGAGTEFRSGQIRCLIVNTAAPAFSGTSALTLVRKPEDSDRQEAANE